MQLTSIPIQVIASVPLLSWLVVCMVFDLRSRLVPTWLTVLPLAAAGIWRLSQGDWIIVL
jgi:Flp pilus assembly protein protease CpaA